MRTTLTLDEDVAAKLKSEARSSGRTFRDIVNESLRAGLTLVSAPPAIEPFRVRVRDLGELRPGLGLDSVADLLSQVEGPDHR
ncbi:MAG: CopG family transcriptional regulator [Acidobacteriota bacterium]